MSNSNIISKSSLEIFDLNGVLVVDSRIIAARLGVQHKATMQLIRNNIDDLQDFGHLPFEMAKPSEGSVGGRPETFCFLNEDQSTYLMTLSKNTEKVKLCKKQLVQAFIEAKRIISTVIPAQNDRILELELKIRLVEAESNRILAEQRLLDTRDTILKLQPIAVADRILGVTTIEKIEIRTKIVDENDRILNAAETVSKTQLAQRYGFVNNKSGTADTKTVTKLIEEAIASGVISNPWHDVRVVASSGFDASLVPALDKFHAASPAQRQRWIGE